MIFPLFVFFWFSILSVMIILLSKTQAVGNILLVSMALVASVRATSYYNEDLSRDLAKMLPFALLGVFLIDISIFSIFESIAMIKTLPSMWRPMVYYLGFVIGLELLLRIIHGVTYLFVEKKEEELESEKLK